MMLRDLGSTGAGRALGLGLLAAWPLYAAGTLMAGLAARGQAERGRPGAAPVAVAAFAGAAAGFLVTGTFLIPAVAPPSIFLGCVVVLSGGAFLYGTSVGDARPESVVHKEATAHGLVEVADRRAGERGIERRLRVNGLVLGAELRESGLPRLDHVRAAAEWLGFRPPRGPVLLVGGGSYALPRLVRERDPDTPITVVERDPAVTRAAYAYFRIQPAHRVRTLYGSARAWVERLSERFELAYVEASGLGRIDTGAVVTVEGLRALAARLEPSGVVLVGGHFTELAAPRLVMASVSGTLCAVFPEVAVYSPMAPAGGEPAAALWAATFGTSDGWPVEVAGWRRWAPDAWLGGRDAVIYTDMEGEPRDISHA
ncbi:MAG: fused MFS/spermidine synthase [Gemmatimonadetes bacterium]|nr:fused MFS/spermidine synthase [Gemmatimonadota bacterium]